MAPTREERTMRRLIILCLLVAIDKTPAFAWVPTDCKDKPGELESFHQARGRGNIDKAWADYREAVQKAQPGSPLYAPHPYPRNDQQVIDNFRYAYFERLFRGVAPEKLPPKERPIYNALTANALRVEIIKVENWDLSRCTADRPHPYYNLLRFFDSATGAEIARSEQYDSGLMASYRHISSKESLPALADLSALLRTRFGRTLPIEQSQYVMMAGLPSCGERHPCIAFKSQGQIYLVDDGNLLYQVDAAAPRISVKDRKQQQAWEGTRSLGVTEVDAPTVTLGFEWGKAKRIAGERP